MATKFTLEVFVNKRDKILYHLLIQLLICLFIYLFIYLFILYLKVGYEQMQNPVNKQNSYTHFQIDVLTDVMCLK